MTRLNTCPMCGSTASLDSTGAAECYGYEWQTLHITCNDDHKKYCDMSVSVSADFSYIKNPEKHLIEMWNSIRSS